MKGAIKQMVKSLVFTAVSLCSLHAWSISVSPSPSAGSYTVSWGPTTGCTGTGWGAVCHTLHEKVGSGSWAGVPNSLGVTSFSFSGKSPNTYQYQILDNWGLTVEGPVSVQVVSIPPVPSKPTHSASDTDGTFPVNWGTSTNATSYTLQEVISGGSTWSTVYTGGSTSYNRTAPDGLRYYRVRACNVAGCSAYSASSTGIYVARTPGVPGTPSISPSTTTDGNHTVSWSAASGTVSKYELQRSTNGSGYSEVYDGASASQPFTGLASGNHTYFVRACNVVSGFESCGGNSGTSAVAVVNRPPTAVTDNSNTDEDTPLTYNIIANDTDPENNALTITAVTNPAHGTVSHDAATITFTPAANDNSNVSVTYTITDGVSNTVGTYNITVNPINDDPVANEIDSTPDSATTLENNAVVIDVLTNDDDIDGDSLSVSAVTQGSNGSVTNNTSNVTYTPNAGYDGNDSFTYTLSDGNGGTDIATVSVTITATTTDDDDGDYTVSWGASSGQVDSYKLEESVNGGAWSEVQSSTALSKVFSGKSNAAYAYRVRACNTSGCSAYNSVYTVAVNYPAPGQVINLAGDLGSADGDIYLDWSTATGIVTYHQVEQTHEDVITTYNTASSNINYTVTGLSDNGEYTFRVRACNVNDCGPYSDPFTSINSEADTVVGVPALTGSIDDPESYGSVFNGVVPGEHNVSGAGAATYSVPIAVPPGTNGMQPSLGLSYSSQSKNGLVGYGWTLAGVGSAINRCPQTLAQNSNVHVVDYSTNDRFCFGGQQLVAESVIEQEYSDVGTEYRTELDSFNRITAQGGVDGDPDWFKVEAKGGQIMEFGRVASARIEATGRSEAQLWLLNKVSDRNGNYYTITYYEDPVNGEFRPTQIDYTGNDDVVPALNPYARVEFVYEARSDVITRYFAGSKSRQSQRLSNVKTYVDVDQDGNYEAAELVQDYQLIYTETDSTDFPRLSSLQLCAPDGSGGEDCSLATSFDWVAEQNAYDLAPANTWEGQAPVAGALQKWADLNGDGRMDYVTSNGATHYVSLVKSDASAYETAASWTAYAKGSSDFETFTDINGDGLADYITIDSNGTHYWSLSTGSGYTNSNTATGHSVGSTDTQTFIDLDGDSLPDYLLASGTTYTVRLNNNGSGYKVSQNWTGGPDLTATSVQNHSFHDVNKDGRSDLVTINGTTHSVYINNGSGFNAAQTWTAHANSSASGFWVDMNGDGLSDYLTIDPVDTTKHYISLSTGTGYANQGTWTAHALDTGSVPDFRDMNGDGLTDYLTPDNNGDHKISLSNGRSGYDNVTWANGHAFGSSNVYDFVDLDGDGKLDFASVNTDGSHNVGISRCQPIHLMTKVTDGLGVETNFDYTALTDTNTYTKGSGAVFPVMDVANPTHVVKTLTHSDGIGGLLTANYQYEGFKLHRQGRGSLGFAKVTVIDEERNTTGISEYEQDWPRTGALKRSEVWLTDIDSNPNNGPDRLLAESDVTYTVNNSAAPFDGDIIPTPDNALTQFTAIDTKTDKVYDPDDGRHLSTTTILNSAPDGYGSATTTTTTIIDKEDSDTEYKTVVTRTFSNDETNWFLGQVSQVLSHNEIKRGTVVTQDTGKDQTTAFTYDTLGRLKTTTAQPGGGNDQELTSTITYDAFGNSIDETISGPGITSRSEQVDYNDSAPNPWHRFPRKLTNALGHIQTQTFDERLGLLETTTGPNNLTTTRHYDSFGRLVKEVEADSSESTVAYYRNDNGAHPDAAIYVETQSTGSTRIRTFYDSQGREIRTRVKGFDGTFTHTDTEYDDKGRTLRSSQPYYVGDDIHWNTPSYDAVNRVVGLVAADETENSTTDYDGFSITQTDNLNRQIIQTSNAIGQVVEMEDAQGNLTTYEYDIAGNAVRIRTGVIDATTYDTEVTSTYDRLGRVTSTTDPDTGLITFTYNALGELTEQVTPELRSNSQNMTLQYDLLGRTTQRDEPETVGSNIILRSTWTYDDIASGNKGLGRLHQEKLERIDGTTMTILDTPFIRTSEYDSSDFGRLSDSVTDIGGTGYTTSFVYDSAGRVSQVVYPSSPSYPGGFTAEYFYNVRGYLEKVHEAGQASKPFYQATDVDAEGRLKAQYLGDGSLTQMGYAKGGGRLLFSNAARKHPTSSIDEDIQNLSYTYDKVGNIQSRSDLLNSLSETFQYDDLDRLTSAQVGSSTAVTYAYNAMGNLTTKGDVGTYTYPANPNSDARPHAVTGVNFNGGGSASYTYDDNGNQLTGDGRTITWTSFDKPATITKNGSTRTFKYGSDGSRYQQIHSDGTTRTYIGGLYLKKQNGTLATHELSIFANGQAVATIIDTDDNGTISEETKYLHRDHLGSITAVTDVDGSNDLHIERLAYDAFGQRRNASTWQGAITGTPTLDRGYTGHEHLDDVDVIHMNGRIYDPTLGRMLSPDPFVQAPFDSQNWNRYSYVVNNPMRLVDPSGFNHELGYGVPTGLIAGAVITDNIISVWENVLGRRDWDYAAGFGFVIAGANFAYGVGYIEAAVFMVEDGKIVAEGVWALYEAVYENYGWFDIFLQGYIEEAFRIILSDRQIEMLTDMGVDLPDPGGSEAPTTDPNDDGSDMNAVTPGSLPTATPPPPTPPDTSGMTPSPGIATQIDVTQTAGSFASSFLGENEWQLIKDIGFGLFREFILSPYEDAVEGRILSAICKVAKPCSAGRKVVDALKKLKKTKRPRVRHHTTRDGVDGIKKDGAINTSRGNPEGVHVETEPFGPPKGASADVGAADPRGTSFVEFDAPPDIVPTKVGPRNTGVIPADKPLNIEDLNPTFKK